LIFESKVQPVDYVEHLDSFDEELLVDVTLNDIMSQNVLELHNQLMHHLVWHNSQVLDHKGVLLEFDNRTFVLRDSFAKHLVHLL